MPEVELSPDLFAQIKAIQIRTARLVNDVMAGEYTSAFKGRGMEFEEVREYQPGDDVRHIDWNVTARTGAAFVKEHREERELTVVLMVDVSGSGSFGTAGKLKREVAAEVAAVLAYTALRSNDRVGLIIFSDGVEEYVPPKKGRAHIWRVIRTILSHQAKNRGTALGEALEYFGRVQKRRAVVFVISDFLDEAFADRLRLAARKHDVTAVTVRDPRESALPDVGMIEFEDAETGELLLIDTHDDNIRRGVTALSRKQDVQRQQLFRSAGIGEISVQTNASLVEPIVRYFRDKERRRRSGG